MKAARNWINTAFEGRRWKEVVEAYRYFDEAATRLVGAQQSRPDKEAWLRGMVHVSERAAYAFARRGDLESAVACLEHGTARLFSEALHARTSGATERTPSGRSGCRSPTSAPRRAVRRSSTSVVRRRDRSRSSCATTVMSSRCGSMRSTPHRCAARCSARTGAAGTSTPICDPAATPPTRPRLGRGVRRSSTLRDGKARRSSRCSGGSGVATGSSSSPSVRYRCCLGRPRCGHSSGTARPTSSTTCR